MCEGPVDPEELLVLLEPVLDYRPTFRREDLISLLAWTSSLFQFRGSKTDVAAENIEVK